MRHRLSPPVGSVPSRFRVRKCFTLEPVLTCSVSYPRPSSSPSSLPPSSGIAGNATVGCWSIALSGGWADDVDNGELFTYTGSGGTNLSVSRAPPNQTLVVHLPLLTPRDPLDPVLFRELPRIPRTSGSLPNRSTRLLTTRRTRRSRYVSLCPPDFAHACDLADCWPHPRPL